MINADSLLSSFANLLYEVINPERRNLTKNFQLDLVPLTTPSFFLVLEWSSYKP